MEEGKTVEDEATGTLSEADKDDFIPKEEAIAAVEISAAPNDNGAALKASGADPVFFKAGSSLDAATSVVLESSDKYFLV